MTPNYLDAGVLIAGWSGTASDRLAVNILLTDKRRAFVGSDFLLIETLPKAIYHKNKIEVTFYERFFNRTTEWIKITDKLMLAAFDEASRTGLSGLDALHVVCARAAGADQLITTEKITKPIFRTSLVTVTTLSDI